MTEKEVMDIGPKTTFNDILDRLQLTDRQREIFILRYGRGMFLSDISEEIGYCRKVVSDELKTIRKKMAQL